MRHLRLPLLVLAVALVQACASSHQTLANPLMFAAADAAPMLQPGDQIRITVWRDTELSGDFQISADSTVSHPLYQNVKVAGVPVSVAEQRIRDFLKQYQANPQVVVEPLFSVAVGGEVRKPDLYPLPRQTTISQAIAMAGGPTEQGRLDKVRLTRNGQQVTVNLTAANADWAHVPVRSGDVIVVGRKHDILREYIGPFASLVAAAAAIVNASRR